MSVSVSSLSLELWVNCFRALMLRSSEAKLKFASNVKDPILKSVMTIIALDHRRTAHILEMLFNIDAPPIDPMSKSCEEVLGKSTLENIKKAISIIREPSREGFSSDAIIEDFSRAIEQLNDITRGILTSLADTLEKTGDPRHIVMRYLASTYENHKKLFLEIKHRFSTSIE
ncbi:MAG: hypothetical protein ACXQTB_01685 [Candidatus Nezhaarchaeales archaeon]